MDLVATVQDPTPARTRRRGQTPNGLGIDRAQAGGPWLRIQLWSYNYDPEPTGIGPVSKTLAEGLLARGHEVVVVAAHPHYPSPAWGKRARPYRERRGGIRVIRLPLWIGRETARERYRQELDLWPPSTGMPDAAGD